MKKKKNSNIQSFLDPIEEYLLNTRGISYKTKDRSIKLRNQIIIMASVIG